MPKLKRKTTTNHCGYRIILDWVKYYLGLVLLVLDILKRIIDLFV